MEAIIKFVRASTLNGRQGGGRQRARGTGKEKKRKKTVVRLVAESEDITLCIVEISLVHGCLEPCYIRAGVVRVADLTLESKTCHRHAASVRTSCFRVQSVEPTQT